MENNEKHEVQLPKEVIRELIASEQFKNTSDIHGCLKGLFKQVSQETMEEMLGCEKHELGDEVSSQSKNNRNRYSPKTVKTQLGAVDIQIPRDRKGEFDLKILPKYWRNAEG